MEARARRGRGAAVTPEVKPIDRGRAKVLEKKKQKTFFFFPKQHDSDGERTLKENHDCVWDGRQRRWRRGGRGEDECKEKKEEKRFYCMSQMVFLQNDGRGKKKKREEIHRDGVGERMK